MNQKLDRIRISANCFNESLDPEDARYLLGLIDHLQERIGWLEVTRYREYEDEYDE